MTTARRNDITGIGLGVAAAAAFGTLAISAKFGYRSGADPMPLLAARFAIASVLLAAYHVVTRKKLRLDRSTLRLGAAGGLLYGFEATLFFMALERAPAGVVGLVFYSYPLWTMLLGFATKLEPVRVRPIVALVIGSVGVALVFSLPSTDLDGPLFALGAAVAVAVYMIAMQALLADTPPAAAAMWTSVGATVALVAVSVVTGQSLPVKAIPSAIALGLASATAFVAIYAAIARIGSARSAIAAMLEPVTTLILAAVLLDEEITVRIVIGAVLVLSTLPILASGTDRRDGDDASALPPEAPPH